MPRGASSRASSPRSASSSASPSATVWCGSVRSSSAEPWVSVLVCDASSPVRADSAVSARESSDQSVGSRSMTSSSTPTVHGAPGLAAQCDQELPGVSSCSVRSGMGALLIACVTLSGGPGLLDQPLEQRELLGPFDERLGVPLDTQGEVPVPRLNGLDQTILGPGYR